MLSDNFPSHSNNLKNEEKLKTFLVLEETSIVRRVKSKQ